MESKSFVVEEEEKKGEAQAIIVERKGGISSWVKLGPESLGFFLDCLCFCLEGTCAGKWERSLKENGRSYSLVRDENKGGCFLRLGGVDLKKKSFIILIPKGRGVKDGWSTMAETLRSLGVVSGRKESQQVEATLLKPKLAKSFAEVVQTSRNKGRAMVRMEVGKEELSKNLNKLGHCLVGFWNPSLEIGEDLKNWGCQMAKFWGLKGNLGLAKLERGKVLLEFELMAEAKKALSHG